MIHTDGMTTPTTTAAGAGSANAPWGGGLDLWGLLFTHSFAALVEDLLQVRAARQKLTGQKPSIHPTTHHPQHNNPSGIHVGHPPEPRRQGGGHARRPPLRLGPCSRHGARHGRGDGVGRRALGPGVPARRPGAGRDARAGACAGGWVGFEARRGCRDEVDADRAFVSLSLALSFAHRRATPRRPRRWSSRCARRRTACWPKSPRTSGASCAC